MKIEFIDKTNIHPVESEVKKIVQECESAFDLTDQKEIEIILVEEAESLSLNKKYRQINKPTDVLSFPQTQFETETNILGSLVICLNVVKKKEETLEDVVKHGFLHLLGYDHETDEQQWDVAAKKINCEL